MTFKKKYISLLLVAGLLLLFFYLKDFIPSNKRTEPYSTFYKQVEDKQIESVTITEDSVTYNKVSDPDLTYTTQNPQSPTLKEFLLKNDVKVKEEKDLWQILNIFLDYAFYIFFFAILFIAFKKFISPNTFKVVRNTGLTFKDLVGMEELKAYMTQVIDIMKNPKNYAEKGIRMPKGIILEGDPGNGKTYFAKALAGQAKINFIPAKATDFESMFMAIGPLKVKMLFRKARRKAPCLIFIDEFDGIGTHRNYSGSAIETENTRIVTALLNELDGFEQTKGVLVLAATNSIQALDKALIRPGRFDTRVSVPYPNEKNRLELIKRYCQNKETEKNCTPEDMASMFKGFSCARIESVINRASIMSPRITKENLEKAIKETER